MQQFLEFALRHWPLFAALALLLAALAVAELRRLRRPYREIDPQEATLLLNRENALPVDLRDKGDHRAGHLPAAVHTLPEDVEKRLPAAEKDRSRPLIFYSRTGQGSVKACQTAVRLGYQSVYSLKGGLLAWRNAGLPLSRSE